MVANNLFKDKKAINHQYDLKIKKRALFSAFNIEDTKTKVHLHLNFRAGLSF